MTDRVSSRGAAAAASPLRIDYEAFQETEADRYHPTANPDGRIPLNIAENRLSWFELKEQLERLSAEPIPAWVAGYTSAGGAPPFREALAHFLETHLTRCPVDTERVVVSPGATGVIEMTAFVLAEAGDVAVIPAPCYPVYTKDLGNFSEIERFDLVTHHEVSEIRDGPALSIDDLERALADVTASGRRFRMLVLTSPDNPTGGIYPIDLLESVADWCIHRGIHLIVNEIYGLSLIDTAHPEIREDYASELEFRSFANVMRERRSEYLHLWYALSKDLGISGFRVGLLHSFNADALAAYENLNLTHSLSNHTQWLLGRLLGQDDVLRAYVRRNQERLTSSYALVARSLKALDVPYAPSRGSLFVWADFSKFLNEESEADELRLWREIFDESGVLLTPGVGFGHSKRGMFRVVYPCVGRSELEVAMERLTGFVEARRAGRVDARA